MNISNLLLQETGGALTQDPEQVTGYTLTGCVRSMFSNRLSYAFDLRGPSFSVDTACSSSLLALQLAVDAIRQDQCDAAIVAGAQLTLTPTAALQFLKLGMLSSAGSCRSFDQSGDGYCRSEAVAAIILQKASSARRIYATVVHAKSNTDGYKEQGNCEIEELFTQFFRHHFPTWRAPSRPARRSLPRGQHRPEHS